jgi:hypothetical protein
VFKNKEGKTLGCALSCGYVLCGGRTPNNKASNLGEEKKFNVGLGSPVQVQGAHATSPTYEDDDTNHDHLEEDVDIDNFALPSSNIDNLGGDADIDGGEDAPSHYMFR